MATAAELQIILTAKDSASQQIDGLGKSLGALGGVGKVAAVGLAGLATVGVGLAAGLASSITAAADFESAMSGVGAVSGASATELAALSAKALQLGQDTSLAGIGATDAAQAMAELAAGGVSTQDILEGAAQGALLLASAGGIAVPRAAEIATNALNQFGLSGAQAGHVADLLAGAANASSADVSDLGESLKFVGPIAHSMGLGIEEVVATLAEFGAQGIKGSQAGTSLRSILASLSDPSNKAKDAMRDLNLEFFDGAGRMKSIAGISEELKTKLGGLTDQQRAQTLSTLFGNEALSAATILYGEGAAGIQKFLGQVDQAGSAAATGAKRNDNLKGSIEQLKSSLETASITLGMAFLPAVRGIVNAVGDAVNAAIPFIQQYGPVLVGALQAGIAVLAGFGQAVGQAALAVLGAFRAFASGQTTLAEFIGGMEIFVTAIRDKLAGLAAAAAPYIGQFFQAIGSAIAAYAPQIAAQFQLWALSFVDWIQTTAIPFLVPRLQAFGQAILDWITGTAVPALRAQAVLLGTALSDWIALVALPAVLAALPAWVLALATGFQAAGAVVAQFGADLLAGIGGALAAIQPLIDAFFAAMTAQLPALQALWGQVIVLFGQAQEALAALAPVGELIAQVLGALLVAAIGSALAAVGGFVGLLTGALPGAIQFASGAITLLGGLFDAFRALVTGVVSTVGALLRGDWAGAWAAAQQTLTDFQAAGRQIIEGFTTAVTGLLSAFIGGTQGLIQGWLTTMIGYLTALNTGGTAVIVQMLSFLLDAFTNFGTNAGIVFDLLVSTVTAALSGLRDTASGIVADLVGEVDAAFTNMVGLIRLAMGNFSSAVIGALLGLVGSAGGAAASIGNAIVDGIAGAISAGAGRIASAAASAAQSALDAAMSLLGIHSPSRAFEYVGEMTVRGFAKGINDNLGLAQRALGGLGIAAPGMGIASSGGMSPLGGGGGGGAGGITVNVQAPVYGVNHLESVVVGAVTSAQRRGRL